MFVKGTFDANNWQNIPNRPGIYAFYLNNISLRKVGLYRDITYAAGDLIKARRVLKKRIRKALEFLRTTEYCGVISEQGRSYHLRKSLKIEAHTHYYYKFIDDIDSIPIQLLPSYVDLLESSLVFHKPIYVGIAQSQTLQSRYIQHRENFENKNEGTFGCRLQGNNIAWEDVCFECTVVTQEISCNRRLVELCEKYIFLVSDPLLSRK